MAIVRKKAMVVGKNDENIKLMFYKDQACSSCQSCSGCNMKPHFITVKKAEGDFEIGDNVFVVSNTSKLFKSTITLYLFPVLMLVLGAIVPRLFPVFKSQNMDLITLISIIIFFILSLVIIKIIDGLSASQSGLDIEKDESEVL